MYLATHSIPPADPDMSLNAWMRSVFLRQWPGAKGMKTYPADALRWWKSEAGLTARREYAGIQAERERIGDSDHRRSLDLRYIASGNFKERMLAGIREIHPDYPRGGK